MKIFVRNDFDVLLKNLGLDNGTYLEIGVWRGRFSRIIHSWNIHKKLYLLDPWRQLEGYRDAMNEKSNDEFEEIHQGVRAYFENDDSVEIIRARSEDTIDKFQDGSFDFIYLDGDHSYEHAKMDIEAWVPKVKKGGVFAGHDYFNMENELGSFGVKRAIDEYIIGKPITLNILIPEDASWYFVKEF